MGAPSTTVRRSTRSTSRSVASSSSNASSSTSNNNSDNESDIHQLSVSTPPSSGPNTPTVAKHIKEIPKIVTRNDFSVLYEPWTVTNFYKKLDWVHMLGLVFMPIYGFWAAFTFVPLVTKTAVFAVAYYFFTGLGITAGKTISIIYFSCISMYPMDIVMYGGC